MIRRRQASIALGLALTLATGVACGPGGERSPRVAEGLSVARTLGDAGSAGFEQALEPRPFDFPADHGPHPRYRTEWWYLTGNLEDATGRHFGYQATFFRSALTPEPVPRESAWAADQLYMAHFALTDTAGGTFSSFERFGRDALGLAGARAEPLRVWVEDWELAARDDGTEESPATDLPPLSLRLSTPEAGLDLRLDAVKPIVLHGERGLSRKGPSAGNASYYYSFTRIESHGTVRVDETEIAVAGESWLDREWSTSLLEPGTAGWDWLALQLDDGSELMYFRLRGEDAASAPMGESGTVVAADGTSRQLAAGDADLAPLRSWTSPSTGAIYPSGWRLSLPAEGLELEIEPRLPQQELVHTFTYWEGAVAVNGQRQGRPVAGAGYVELTGYGDEGGTRLGTSSAVKSPL